MRILLDIDKTMVRNMEEELEQFFDCIKERKKLLVEIEKVENDKINQFETCFELHHNCKPYIYFSTKEEVIKNKEFILTILKLGLKDTERCLEELMERLGIEKYEE